jgi:hypothetical protein
MMTVSCWSREQQWVSGRTDHECVYLKCTFLLNRISSPIYLVMLISYLQNVNKGYTSFPKIYVQPQNSMHTAHKLLRIQDLDN